MGRGIRASRPFDEGEYVIEYVGDLIQRGEALEREKIYDTDPDKYGSYMFFFNFEGSSYW